MDTREVIYINENNVVVDLVCIGESDPDELLQIYGYSSWLDRSDFPNLGIGWHKVEDEWRPPSPYPSWIWRDNGWFPPQKYPQEEGIWIWDEDSVSWIQSN